MPSHGKMETEFGVMVPQAKELLEHLKLEEERSFLKKTVRLSEAKSGKFKTEASLCLCLNMARSRE